MQVHILDVHAAIEPLALSTGHQRSDRLQQKVIMFPLISHSVVKRFSFGFCLLVPHCHSKIQIKHVPVCHFWLLASPRSSPNLKTIFGEETDGRNGRNRSMKLLTTKEGRFKIVPAISLCGSMFFFDSSVILCFGVVLQLAKYPLRSASCIQSLHSSGRSIIS